jgi:hypothetical protein
VIPVVQAEHAVEDRLIVEAEDQDRQVLAKGAEVDGEVRGDGRLAYATLVAADGEDLEGAPARPAHHDVPGLPRLHESQVGAVGLLVLLPLLIDPAKRVVDDAHSLTPPRLPR